ncbi:basic proline-rich protein-like [Cervus elaphus]|uniref:basic proline-rich protein-like n=1 Tax=Cervus elaphus TaxID=9860 RepID=UPI001CC3307B|nr:basic proline-rich protein-like [Cervus elaphus]
MEEPLKQGGPSESAGSKKSSSKKFQKLSQEDRKIALTPLSRPPRACRPAGEPPGGPRRIRPSSAAVPPGGPGGPEGARGGPGCGGRGQGAAAAGPAGPRPNRHPHPPAPLHTPTPARAGRAARPAPAPAGPLAGGPPSLPVGAPQAPESPAPATPAPALSPFHSLPGAWRGPANPRPHVSVLAARPACAAQPAALREPGDVGRAWGRFCLPFSCFFFFFSFPPFPSAGLTDQSERRWQWTRKLGCRCYGSPRAPARAFPCQARGSTPAVSTGAWGRKRGRNWGCLRNVCVCSRGENVSASSDGKKSLQDTGFPI